jgi:hypothetical protein
MVRTVHLVLAIALGLLVYLPTSWSAELKLALMVVGVPLATASGILLWQQGRITRWINSHRARNVTGNR